MTPRDLERLDGVHPMLIRLLTSILSQMDAENAPMFVVCGVRTTEEQQALFAKGRTEPGSIVTYDDGVTRKSGHQVTIDGWGHAVDCAFVDAAPFADYHPWEKYGTLVQAAGLEWGGSWHFRDLPHAELVVAPSGSDDGLTH